MSASVKNLVAEVPLYGGKIVNSGKLIAYGGGGSGNHGVPNEIISVNLNGNAQIDDIFELPKDEDSPTSLDISCKGFVAVGINSSNIEIAKGINKHLRLYKLEELNKDNLDNSNHLEHVDHLDHSQSKLKSRSKSKSKAKSKSKSKGNIKKKNELVPLFSQQVFHSKSDIKDEYQKYTKFSLDGNFLALGSSVGQFSILDSSNMKDNVLQYIVKPQFIQSNSNKTLDIEDLNFTIDGESLLILTQNKLFSMKIPSKNQSIEFANDDSKTKNRKKNKTTTSNSNKNTNTTTTTNTNTNTNTNTSINLIPIAYTDNRFRCMSIYEDTVIIAENLKDRKGSKLIKYKYPFEFSSEDEEDEEAEILLKSQTFNNKAANSIASSKWFVAVAGADLSVTIVSINTLALLKVFRYEGAFAITQVMLYHGKMDNQLQVRNKSRKESGTDTDKLELDFFTKDSNVILASVSISGGINIVSLSHNLLFLKNWLNLSWSVVILFIVILLPILLHIFYNIIKQI